MNLVQYSPKIYSVFVIPPPQTTNHQILLIFWFLLAKYFSKLFFLTLIWTLREWKKAFSQVSFFYFFSFPYLHYCLHPNHVLYYTSFLLSLWDMLPDPIGCLKLQIVPNSIPNMASICTYIPMRKSIGFSLACLNRQHHYFCTSGPLLSKIRVIWTQALWYHESGSGNWEGHHVSNGQRVQTARTRWTKGWLTSWAGGSLLAGELITLLRVVHDIKRMSYLFLEYFI